MDVGIREGAIRALGEYGGHAREALPEMLEALRAEEPRVRRAAAWALGRLGRRTLKRSRPALEVAIDDPDDLVRRHARRALDVLETEVGLALWPAKIGRVRETDWIIRIRVDGRGRVFARGRYRLDDIDELLRFLVMRADSYREDRAPYFAAMPLQVNLDADAPWVATRAVLALAAHPIVRFTGVWFGPYTRGPQPDELRISLPPLPEPGERAASSVSGPIPVDEARESAAVRLEIGYDAPPADPAALREALRRRSERQPGATLGLRVDPRVPSRVVLSALVDAAEAGLVEVKDQDPPLVLAGSIEALVEGLPSRPTREPGVRLDGEPVGSSR
jgi:hypothetical protein